MKELFDNNSLTIEQFLSSPKSLEETLLFHDVAN